jgi:membrane protease YdiL (CAAX protease family)
MLCALLMVRTRSVIPAMLLHGAVNAVVVLA